MERFLGCQEKSLRVCRKCLHGHGVSRYSQEGVRWPSAQHTWAPTKELCKAQDPAILATIPKPKLVSKCTQRMLTFI